MVSPSHHGDDLVSKAVKDLDPIHRAAGGVGGPQKADHVPSTECARTARHHTARRRLALGLRTSAGFRSCAKTHNRAPLL